MVKRRDACLQLLTLDLALRLYAEEHGDVPERLEQLVPAYLPSVPRDPFGGRPPVYRITGSTFARYSAGPNEQDDGGRFGALKELTSESASTADRDFDLDTVLR